MNLTPRGVHSPHTPSRIVPVVSRDRIQKIHDAAAARGDNSYIDPSTGMLVMTAHYLDKRGFCCGAGCRHCPYPPAEQVAAGRPPDAESWQQPS